MRVLKACLGLLEADSGPALEDYPEDVPVEAHRNEDDMIGMVCEIELPPPPSDDNDLTQALLAEIDRMQPWYEMAVNQRGRTTVGLSGFSIADAARYLMDFIEDPSTPSRREDLEAGPLLKLACEDLKAYYGEAMSAQPGMSSSLAVEHWLWNETTLGRMFWKFRAANTGHPDRYTRYLAQRTLIPDRQVHHKGAPVFETDSSH